MSEMPQSTNPTLGETVNKLAKKRKQWKANKDIPLDEIEDEKKTHMEELESATDALEHYKVVIKDFYRKYRAYLPESNQFPGQQMKIDELKSALSTTDFLVLFRTTLMQSFLSNETPPYSSEQKLIALDQATDILTACMTVVSVHEDYIQLWGEHTTNETALTPSQKEVRAYHDWRFGPQENSQWNIAERTLTSIDDDIALFTAAIDYARSTRNPNSMRFADIINMHQAEIVRLNKQRELFISEHKEGYFYEHANTLQQAKDILDNNGRIIETPYIKRQMARVQDYLDRGQPVFIHGELGTGKTELAIHIAKKRHPDVEEPPIISGHRNLDTDDIIARTIIKRKMGIPPEEQVKLIQASLEEFEKDNPALFHDPSEFGMTREELRQQIIEAHQRDFTNPIETAHEFGAILKAMRDGCIVIIDEINAIPHHLLIVLNHYLTRKPGDTVRPPLPGAEEFVVAEGFGVIATGNYKPEDDNKKYVGRSKMDTALLSRFGGIISHEYLPAPVLAEPRAGSPEEIRKHRSENELRIMLFSRLLDNRLELHVPEGTGELLDHLTLAARVLQDAFSGNPVHVSNHYDKGGTKVHPRDVLKENVLSLRHLIPILELWKSQGFNPALDVFIFQEYILRSSALPDEKRYLFQILQEKGFFDKNAGWPDGLDSDSGNKLTEETLKQQEQKSYHRQIEHHSMYETIELIFGPAPERTNAPRILIEQEKEPEPEPEPEVSFEERAKEAQQRERIRAMMGKVTDGKTTNEHALEYERTRRS